MKTQVEEFSMDDTILDFQLENRTEAIIKVIGVGVAEEMPSTTCFVKEYTMFHLLSAIQIIRH